MSRRIPHDTASTSETEQIDVLFAGDGLESGPNPSDIDGAGARFVVNPTNDFVEARERVTEQSPDCVVATYSRDGFDGVAFLEDVRIEYPDLPVILVPATIDDVVASRAVAADATALVPGTQPGALDDIVAAIENNVVPGESESVRMPISDLTIEAEHRLKEQALDEAPIGITISDATEPDHPLVYINESFEEMTGYPAEEILGANHRFLQGPDTDPDKVSQLGSAVDAGRDVRVVLRNYTREGETFWNQVDISPIYDQDGTVTHYVGFQMDVTERKAAEKQLQAERETLDRLLDRVEGLVSDVTESLVAGESREEIERAFADRIGRGDEYAGAWIGRYDPAQDRVAVTQQVGSADTEETSLRLDGSASGLDTLRDVIEDREMRTVQEATGLPGIDADKTGLLVPLTYRTTTYGVLAVINGEGFIDSREQVVLESLGRITGASINDVVTKRTITADNVIEIEVEITDDVFFVDLASSLETTFDHEATIPDDDDVLSVVSTSHGDVDKVVEAAERHPDVLAAETLVEMPDESVVQFRLADSQLIDILSASGCRITTMSADEATLELGFRVGTERAANRVIDTLRETYERVELTTYQEITPEKTPYEFREELREELTERQYVALKKAYVSGYFEWPRQVEGEQLAESMNIVASTYHQHLQAAKRKLVGAFFDE